MRRFFKKPQWFLSSRLFLFLALISALWFVALLKFVQGVPAFVFDPEQKTDAIIVLTGGSKRLDEGLRLLENGLAERLFVSGVYKGTEVRSLVNLSHKKKVNLAENVSIGNAVNTEGNAAETAAWVSKENVGSIRLVTAAYHMPRSLFEFKYTMPNLKIIPHPVFPETVKHKQWWLYPGTAMLLITEHNKLIFAWVRQKVSFYLAKP